MASLFSALTVAVGGLAAQSSAIGNISDNLANTNTTGFKGITTKFESLVTQSNANNNDPGGVKASPFYTNGVQGNLVSDSAATSLAISGQGYFAVRAATVQADGTTSFDDTTYFTRAGDFVLNKGGYLVNGAGYYLTGWEVNQLGDVDRSQAVPIQLAELLDNPVATSSIDYSANLPSSVSSTLADVFEASPSTIQIYDELGAQHNMSFTWEKAASNAHAAASIIVDDALTLVSQTTGTFGNDISLTITGAPGAYTATITADGRETETYNGIAATGNAYWVALAAAINAGSELVNATAGTATGEPTVGTASNLAGGTGDFINWTASVSIGDEITFNALEEGLGGNDITVTIAAGAGTNRVITIADPSTAVSESYTIDTAAFPAGAFWTELMEQVNAASTLVVATTGGGVDAPVNAAHALSGGETELSDVNTWYLHVEVPGGGGVDTTTGAALNYTATIPFIFNSTTTTLASAGTLQSMIAAGGTGASGTYTVSTLGAAQLSFNLDFSGAGITSPQGIVVNLGSFNSSTNGVTQFADNSVTVSTFEQNGIPRGSFQDLSIDENGYVSLNYDNGRSRIISQIPMVQFFAQEQLQRISGGVYQQTLASGTARYSAPGENGSGTIVGNALEGSNVDIATEFTKMIQAQRVYSANSRVISTTDNMLEEIINIVR